MTIKEWNEDERPRERLLSKGQDALSDAELLAIILRSGTKNESAVEIARKILKEAGNDLRSITGLTVERLTKIKGMGEAKAVCVIVAAELAKRIALPSIRNLPNINSSSYAAKIIAPVLRDLPHEECWIMYLNRANRLLAKERLSKGGISATVVDVKLIIKNALERLASALSLVHNHPSGNPNPGEHDRVHTKRISEAAAMFDITLLDHLIIAGDSYYSFADEGLLE